MVRRNDRSRNLRGVHAWASLRWSWEYSISDIESRGVSGTIVAMQRATVPVFFSVSDAPIWRRGFYTWLKQMRGMMLRRNRLV